MNHKLKRRWVAALRGRRWRQCREAIFRRGNYRCALGVLGEVVGLDQPARWHQLRTETGLLLFDYRQVVTLNERAEVEL
jgi:hypothetical protein